MSSFFIFIALTLAAGVTTGLTLKFLRKKAILDQPNERSSHCVPTPRGGGLGVLAIILPSLGLIFAISPQPPSEALFILGSLLALAGISWLDDIKTLGAASRFGVQILCVVFCLSFMTFPTEGLSFGLLPFWLEKIIMGMAWIWFINLFNFMDGINGITGTEVLSINGGLLILGLFLPLSLAAHFTSLALAAAALGFLYWNWGQAKIFMGDVGSIPLGFLIGWVLIGLALEGYGVAALILPLYYLMDATLTLLNRLRRGEKIWQAHREHFYQKAHQSGLSHSQVVTAIGLLNLTLIGCAVFSLDHPVIALILAFAATSLLLYRFHTRFIRTKETS